MRTILLASVLALAATTGCKNDKAATSEQAADEFPTMTLDEVEKAVAADEATPVDANGDRTRKKLGVLPTAIVLSDEETYPVSELPADKSRRLVFYCSDSA